MRTVLVVLLSGLLPGCYLWHDQDGPGGTARPDAASVVRPDAGVAPPPRDAGRADAGPPAPSEPEPDTGPRGRPSDSPDADEWEDPPDVDPDDPCCLLGDPVLVTSRDLGMALDHAPPLIAWGAGGWRLAYARYFDREGEGMANRVVTVQLAVDGAVVSAPEIVPTPAVDPMVALYPQSLRWRGGRWALAVSGDHRGGMDRDQLVRLYDSRLVPASEWLLLGSGSTADVAYLAHGDRWLGVVGGAGLGVAPFDERGGVATSSSHPVVAVPHRAHVEGFQSRAAALVEQRGTPSQVRVLDPEGGVLGGVGLTSPGQDHAALGRVRDLAIVAQIAGGEVAVELVDPFAIRGVGRQRSIGGAFDPSDGALVPDHAVDVAGLDKYGIAGVCWGIPGGGDGRRDGAPSRILFRVVGEDGRPRGAAVEIVSSPFRGDFVNCTVGSDGLGFLVGWWDGSELWVRRVDVPR